MPLTLSWTAHSEIGLVRKNNQDSAYVSPTMAMVADGMGGAAAGDLASAVAVNELRRTDETLLQRLADAAAARLAAAGLDHEPEEPDDTIRHDARLVDQASDVLSVLSGALQRANDTINDLIDADPDLDGMGTTVCGFVLHDDALAMVNIGDSRAYRVRDGQLTRLTHDHSWVQTLVDDGRITEAEALEHPHRSLVLRVLNGSPAHRPDLRWVDLRPGDRILVCSDGLCGLVTDAAIAARVTIPDRDAAVQALVDLAHAAGGHDNITIILADAVVDGPPGTPTVLGSAATTRIPTAEHTAPLPVLDAPDAAPGGRPGRGFTESDRYAPFVRRPGTLLKVGLGVLLPVLVLVGAAWGWYGYTQTRYFVGAQTELVAIFQGVPDRVLGLPLSSLVETDTTRIADLPPRLARQVEATIRVESLDTARTTVRELRASAEQCISQREARARATATPSPGASPSVEPLPGPLPTDTPTPGTTAEVTPAPSSTPVVPAEECS